LSVSPDQCAHELLDLVPLIMRSIRTEIRKHRNDLTIPQFRTLAYLNNYRGASLSEVAEHIGLTLPSMSKLIDGLVARQLVTREISPSDRRCVTLALTEPGQATLQATRAATQTYLARRLDLLSTQDRATVNQALQILRPLFSPTQELTNDQHR
jgi:MarR family transcriptional regulator for hemolysin